jgi:UDP-N-acetyl-D-glucosamine dehydrogenase
MPVNEIARKLRQAVDERNATIGIIGLGYVGLPLAATFGKAGFRVLGVDADPARVARLLAGESPVEDVPSGVLLDLLRRGSLSVSGQSDVLAQADAILICVPTPLGKSKEPDISHVLAATDAVARILRPGQLVILESTTYPGTTEEVLLPRFRARGLEVGTEFFLAFSPERIDPGNTRYDLSRIPKVVGGVTPVCQELARSLYSQIIEQVVPVSSPRVAEMVKLFENVFRSVNIALVNELAVMCRRLGLSVWEVIEAAATKPFGFMPFYPGPGIGGHCLPTDPYYLSWKARLAGYEPKFITFADEINSQMPAYVVQLAADALNDRGKPVRGSRVLVLGVAYKPGVGDTRDSPAVEIMELLRAKGAELAYVDPHVPEFAFGQERLTSLAWDAVDFGAWDLVLILTHHPEFDPKQVVQKATLVLDTRNATGSQPGPLPHVIRL